MIGTGINLSDDFSRNGDRPIADVDLPSMSREEVVDLKRTCVERVRASKEEAAAIGRDMSAMWPKRDRPLENARALAMRLAYWYGALDQACAAALGKLRRESRGAILEERDREFERRFVKCAKAVLPADTFATLVAAASVESP